MRRFLTLVFLLLFTIPFGVSISGCSKKSATVFCNGGDTGPAVGQVSNITLQPKIFGVSLNFSQISQVSAPSAVDCKGTTVTVSSYTYATFLPNGQPDMTIADVQPTTGRLCAGTWNRNTGGGIADFTTCNPTNKSGTVYVVANGGGVSSNPLPVFVHPVVTNVTLGPLSTDCVNDPATNCSPAAFDTQASTCAQTTNGNGCCAVPVPTTATAAAENGCVSQSVTSQLAARVVAGNGANISCQVGHLSYAPQTAAIVTIDENGVATAQQPGSTVITANISNAGSSAGFFSTCPPISISLTAPVGTTPSTSVTVNPNNVQPINVLAIDKNNTILTGLALNFESTTPTTIPAASAASVTPIFPGAAAITAVCQPPTCNPAPFNQIGLFGNGKAITSNPVLVTAPGTNSTNLYIASTNSFYLVPVDFTQPQLGSPVRLPYQPNSMVISNDGSTVYMGSSFELMTFSATTNSLGAQDTTVPGSVLAISPDGSTLVITDPIRQFVYLYNTTGSIQTQYGGVGTHAVFSPDSTTVYITLGNYDASTGVTNPNNQLLVHSTFTGWYQTQTTLPNSTTPVNTSDVAIGVPSVGAFFAGSNTTARSYCPEATIVGLPATTSSTTTNLFYPDAAVLGPQTDRIATTDDGQHVLGATVTPSPTFTDLSTAPGLPNNECPETNTTTGLTKPQTFPTSTAFTGPLPGITATAITGVLPTSDSKIAFITYQGSGAVVPTYTPQATGAGTLGSIPLSTALGTPIAPVAGVVSADNQTFFAGTSGDNAVHLITKQTDGTYKDTTTPIAPKLPDVNGNIVTPNLLVQKPRKATS
ncbi:YncE family protein [Tunturiibacter psychrotolerans]|uniref:YncE family protein n=1 Tax=Tunturiibacter psychrotolerans TaxID=3069686 RepID=UPI003D25FC74